MHVSPTQSHICNLLIYHENDTIIYVVRCTTCYFFRVRPMNWPAIMSEAVCRSSIVDIATGYGLDSPGIESRWGRNFRTYPVRPRGSPSLLYDGYRVFPGGKERPGRDTDPSPPSSAVSHERVELYLYSPYGPYSLYRASVPVQGCSSHLPYLYAVTRLDSHIHSTWLSN